MTAPFMIKQPCVNSGEFFIDGGKMGRSMTIVEDGI